MPANVPASAHDEPAAELSTEDASGPSLIWKAFSVVPTAGRTWTGTSKYTAPGVYKNWSPFSEPKSTSMGAAIRLAGLLTGATILGEQETDALKATATG
eukprot:6407313-Prymnesium_polylepis.1